MQLNLAINKAAIESQNTCRSLRISYWRIIEVVVEVMYNLSSKWAIVDELIIFFCCSNQRMARNFKQTKRLKRSAHVDGMTFYLINI